MNIYRLINEACLADKMKRFEQFGWLLIYVLITHDIDRRPK
jgi:hypothetical protein